MAGHVEALLCVTYHVDPGATTDTVLPRGTESLGRERETEIKQLHKLM